MRCPRCGYDFNSAILEVGFHKCDYHPDMIYICDGCKREVHHAYKEKQNWVEPKGIKIPFQKEYTYLCLDCMRKYGHYHDLLECDQQMSTEQGENMWKVEKLYKNVGIKPLCQIPDEYCRLKNVYEDFTAEKQIELIKFLIKDYYYYLDAIDVNNFENSLAKLINDLWQYLTEEERKQVKEILE